MAHIHVQPFFLNAANRGKAARRRGSSAGDEHIRRYADLLAAQRELSDKLTNNSAPVGRPKAIATEVAEQTGLSSRTFRRALNPKPAPEPEHAKQIYETLMQACRS